MSVKGAERDISHWPIGKSMLLRDSIKGSQITNAMSAFVHSVTLFVNMANSVLSFSRAFKVPSGMLLMEIQNNIQNNDIMNNINLAFYLSNVSSALHILHTRVGSLMLKYGTIIMLPDTLSKGESPVE